MPRSESITTVENRLCEGWNKKSNGEPSGLVKKRLEEERTRLFIAILRASSPVHFLWNLPHPVGTIL